MLSRSVIFITVHKGASTFIADELGRHLVRSGNYSDFRPIGAMRLKGKEVSGISDWPDRGVVGVRVYPTELQLLKAESPGFSEFAEDASFVFVQRDPRDTAISLFFSKAYSHTPNVLNRQQFIEERERLQALPTIDGVKQLTGKIAIGELKGLHRMHTEHGGLMTRYEDLVTNPEQWFADVGKHVEWNDKFVADLTAKFADSFAPPSEEDPLQHKRRITPGNWTEVFDDALLEHFDNEIGDMMRANGYD